MVIRKINSFLENFTIPKMSNFEKQNCERVLSEKEIFESTKCFPNNKSHGNVALTKEFIMPSEMKLSNHL